MQYLLKLTHVMTWEIVVAFKIIICLSNITNNNLIVFIYMAEIAIPLIALGSMYVISNQDDDKNIEGYTNMGKPVNALPNVIPPEPPINFPKTKGVTSRNVRAYKNANQTTDKYFNQQVFKMVEQDNPRDSVGGSTKSVMGLTGEPINKADFKHNNMKPFFGARVKGSRANMNQAEATLDNMQGAGTHYRKKREQAPLFKPQANMSWANGMPNMNDFLQSRVNPSTKMSNIKPWEEEKVAPGLGLGYTTSGSGSGYNAAVEDRNAWLPKTVNQLRVDTNPKMSFGLQGHQGPATAYIKDYGHIENQGRVEKNRPDTDYTVGPSRWFTTTGIEKKQTARGIEVLQHQNRPETTVEYFGTGGDVDSKATYVVGQSKPTLRQQLDGPLHGTASASHKAAPTTGDYGNGTYQNLCNNRSTTRQAENLGGVQGMIKAVVAPIFDVLRPTKKENVIGNLRPNGNVQNLITKPRIYDPADRVRTTIREQTGDLLDNNHLNVDGIANGDAYMVTKHQAYGQERDTTNVAYGGSAGPAASYNSKSYAAEYNQRNNPNKIHKSHTNHGVSSTLNSNMNIAIGKRDSDRNNGRAFAGGATIGGGHSTQTYGHLSGRQQYDQQKNNERMNPDILTAFKNNPYTQSLNSWA